MTTVQWPNAGNNSKYFILNVPNVTSSILRESLEFISTHCFYMESAKRQKFLPFPGIHRLDTTLVAPIMMENLFINPDLNGTNDIRNRDMFRFQTPPEARERLLQCNAINVIVSQVSSIIAGLSERRYIPHQISVIFSRPFGNEQGLHHDDHRDTLRINEEGEMLSAVVALMKDTKLDIGTDVFDGNSGRKTFIIPAGAMFLMSGQCLHGGSAYSVCNARLHIEFLPDNLPVHNTNTVAVRYGCPIEDCPHRIDRKSFATKNELYYHWKTIHRDKVRLSLNKFIFCLKGGQLVTCEACEKQFKSKRVLTRHSRTCKGFGES